MSDNRPQKKGQKPLNNYARYSGLAFQMVIIILAGTFGGIQLDKWVKFKFPVFTVVLSLGSVLLAMYIVLKEFISDKSDE
jgi:ATP synthase protein I